jgi:hypothetical protein
MFPEPSANLSSESKRAARKRWTEEWRREDFFLMLLL